MQKERKRARPSVAKLKGRNILFVCKYNRFRSQVAESYFKKINKNKKVKVQSAGIIQIDRALTEGERARNKYLRKKHGLKIKKRSKGLRAMMLQEVDKVIVVANDVPKEIFTHWRWKDKIEIWKIKDEPGAELKKVETITNQIKKKVEELVKDVRNN